MDRIGQFEVLGELARGGMGVVYRGKAPTGAPVAIKVLLAAGRAGERETRRFLREGRVLTRLAHPNLVRVHTVDQHNGAPYLVMDLIPGESLSTVLARQGALDREDAVELVRKLALGVQHAQRQGARSQPAAAPRRRGRAT